MIEVKLPNTKPTKHSFAGTGNQTNPNVGCISQKLKDSNAGDVIYCAISGPDAISCSSIPFNSTDPEYLDSLRNRYATETDPDQKVILKGQLLQNYLANDSTYNSAFAFLDTLPRDSFAMRALLPLYLQAQMPDSADAVLKMMTDSSLIGSKTLTIYGIALMLAYDNLKVFDISSLQEEYLRDASEGNDEAAMIAQAILETVKGDVYERLPEEITEARLAEMQVENKPSNDVNWIMASPNPFKETTQITFNVLNDAESAFVEVYNSLGQRVVIEHVKNSGKLTINLKGMKAGVYQCHLLVNGALSASKKLILMD